MTDAMKEIGAPMSAAKSEWRRGWPIVLCATIGVAFYALHYAVMGAIMLPLTQAYGWTRGEVAFGLTIASLIGPLANVMAGVVGDRFGPRPVALFGALLFGASYAMFSLAGPALWSWYAVSALFAICSHFAGPIIYTMAVVRQFSASRGLALALALSGSGIMMSFMPTIMIFLLESVGLRGSFLVLALAASLLMFVPSYFFFKDNTLSGQSVAARQAATANLPGLSLGQTLSGTRFWRLSVALLAVSATVGMFLLHFQPMLIDSGLSPSQAASVALIIGPAMIIGRLGTGLLFDRLSPRLVSCCAFAVLTIACTLMLGFDGGISMAITIAAIIGLGIGAEVDVIAYMTSRYFGLRSYGVLFGILMGVYGIGAGGGSAVGGWVFDSIGSYDPLFIILGIGCAFAGLIALTLGDPDVPEQRK